MSLIDDQTASCQRAVDDARRGQIELEAIVMERFERYERALAKIQADHDGLREMIRDLAGSLSSSAGHFQQTAEDLLDLLG